MKLRTKILIPFFLFVLILSLRFFFLSYFVSNSGKKIEAQIANAQKVNELTTEILQIRQRSQINLLSYRFSHDPQNLETLEKDKTAASQIYKDMDKYLTSSEGRLLFQKYLDSLVPLRQARSQFVAAMQKTNEADIQKAYNVWQQYAFVNSTALDNFNTYNFASLQTSGLLYKKLNLQLLYLFILAGIVTVLFTFGFFMYLRRILTSRVLEISSAAHDISEGKFDVELAPRGNDELGDLAMSVNKMGEKLKVHYQQLLDDVQRKQKEIQRNHEFEEQKDMFISLASHELKTPLTSILLFEELLLQLAIKEHNTPYVSYLKRMNTQITKLANLITSLLDVTKIKVGRMSLQKSTFDIQEVINEAVGVAKDLYPTYTIVIEHNPHLSIHADRGKIGQVLTNLIDNAVKYSLGKKDIVIDVHKKKGEIIVSLQDFGRGVPNDQQQRIFERFYQISPHATNPGLGLGLFICSEIIKHHGGKIWVESKEGKGSTFYFSLPL